MSNNVDHPAHYSRFQVTIEPKEFTKWLPHPLASAMEYILRAPYKGNETEDLKKAVFWLDELIVTLGFWRVKLGETDSYMYLDCAFAEDSAFTYRVAAWAMAIQSPEVRMLFEDSENPLRISRRSVQALAGHILDRIERLEKPMTPVEGGR